MHFGGPSGPFEAQKWLKLMTIHSNPLHPKPTKPMKDRKTERQKDRKTERQKDGKTERQKDKILTKACGQSLNKDLIL